MNEVGAQLSRHELVRGEVLIAQLLGLLVTLIGEVLTRRLMEEAWPGDVVRRDAILMEKCV